MRLTLLACALNLAFSSGGPLPPTPVDPGGSGDPQWTNVTALLHFNLSVDSSTVVDETKRLWTTTTAPTIVADGGAVDGYSGRFSGGAFVENTTKTDWGFLHNGQPFTVEGYFTVDALSGTQIIFNNNAGVDSNVGMAVWVESSGNLRILVSRGVAASPVLNLTLAGVVTAAGRKYLTVQYNKTTNQYTTWLNGILVSTDTPAQTFSTAVATDALRLARASSGASPNSMTGNLDEWRFSNGIVRYSANFTPPVVQNPSAGAGDPYGVNYASLLHFEGANNSTTFTDQNGKVWTGNGSPVISTAQYVFGASSLFLDGSSYISTPNSSDHSFSGQDVTMEFRFRPTTLGLKVIASKRAASTAREYTCYISTDNKIHFTGWNSAGVAIVDMTGTTTVALNTNYAVAVVKNGSIWYLLVNGFVEATANVSGTIGTNSLGLMIGYDGLGDTTRKFNGYIDEFRFTQAALYVSNYTPATQPFPNARVVSRLNFNGPNAGTTITDKLGKVWTASGNAQLSTTVVKYGTTSLKVDGNGDSINTPHHSDFEFGSEDFTIEGWAYQIAAPTGSNTAFMWCKDNAAATRGMRFYTNAANAGKMGATFQHSAGTVVISGLAAFPVGALVYVTLVRFGNSLLLFQDGILQSTGDVTGLSLQANTNPVYMGSNGANQGGTFFNGYLDDWRVTRGLARYTANFTPPAAELPTAYGWDNSIAAPVFYRVSISDTQVSGNPVMLGEMHLYSASAEVTYTQITASSVNGVYPIANLTDGSAASEFRTVDNPSQWILLQCPTGTVLDHITITPPSSGTNGTPKNFVVEKLNPSNTWDTLITATGQTLWTAGTARTYSVATGTYAADPIPPPPVPTPDPETPYPTRVRGATQVSVRNYGALGNGVHDDLAAFNAAIAALPSDGGTVNVPAGTYLIGASKTLSINLRSNMLLKLATGAVIKCKPNNFDTYYMIRVKSPVHDVEIAGGEIQGERDGHTGTTGEWGYGIRIEGAKKVTVRDTKVSKCWGDGIIFGGAAGSPNPIYADDLWLWNVISDNNRRQGLTIGLASNVHVEGCTLTNTNGTAPEAGIDIEPDSTGAFNVVIKNNTITGNAGAGVLMWQHGNHTISVINNVVSSNKWGIYGDSVSDITVTGNRCEFNQFQGIRIDKNNNNWTVNNNILGFNSGGTNRVPDVVKSGYDGTVRTQKDLIVYSTATNINIGPNTYE